MTDDDIATGHQRKPCGYFHPLPCGLDVDCEAPVEYFTGSESDEETWERYMASWNENGVD